MQTIKIAVEGKETIPFTKLEPFQEDLKSIAKEQYESLKNTILKDGFSFTIHVWKNRGKVYVIDGHQRLFTLKQMHEIEGYKIPNIPVSLVKAGSFAEAKRKVLAGASQYGTVSQKGLHDFITKNDIPFDTIVANYYFPEVDWGTFSDQFMKPGNIPGVDAPPPPGPGPGKMTSGSDSVKQIQLFFNSETHAEFMEKMEVLALHYETENITDTVMEAIRADHKIKSKLA